MDSDTETAEPPRKKRRSSWDILCPEDSTTLFYTIIFGNEYNEVNKWLLFLENDNWNAKIILIQLFFDVAGYNHINIKDFFMKEHEDTIDVDQSLYPNIEKTEGKYFLNVNTKRFLILAQKLGRFITILAKKLFNKKLLLDKNLVTIFLKIWRQMTDRNLCAMFHTGIFFAIKFKTGLIEIDHEINESCSKYPNQSRLEELLSTQNICKKYIKFIDKCILHGKWNLGDPKLCHMRYQCTQEIKEWMNLIPFTYINKEHIEYLVAGMKDQSKHVRFNSLDTFYFALKQMDYKIKLSQNLQLISGRLNDLDINVAVLAVEVLSFIGMKYNGLPEYIDKKILDCVYSSYAELADACGNYLIEKYKDNEPEETLLELVTFQIESERKNSSKSKTALLVGAVMNHIPFLQDVHTYILALRKLTEMNADSRPKTVLLEMLDEVFQLVLFGEPTYKRHNFVCPVSKSNAKNIIIGLYNYLDDIKKFYSTKDLLKILREMTRYFSESPESHDEIYEALME